MRSDNNDVSAAALLGLYAALLRNWAVSCRRLPPEAERLDDEGIFVHELVEHVGDLCLGLLQVRPSPLCGSVEMKWFFVHGC